MNDIYNTLVGTISLIVGVISLVYSIIGYKESKKAAAEAKEAKENAGVIGELLERINYAKEIRNSFQEEYGKVCCASNNADTIAGLLAILHRIKTAEPSWNFYEIDKAVFDLEEANTRLHDGYDDGRILNAISFGKGQVAAYIDNLGRKINKISQQYADQK